MKLRISCLLFVALFIVLALPSQEAYGQMGFISGEVLDEAGQPIPDVNIRIEGMNLTRKYRLKTDKNGKYVHAGISIQGIYRVIAEKEGYRSDYVQNIKPGFSRNEERSIVDFKLSKGETGKLAFEMTDEERAEIQRQQEEAKKQAAALDKVRDEFNQGVTLYNAGQYPEAAAAFQQVLQVDQGQHAVWANLGNCYSRMNQNDKAVEAYTKAVELDPENAAYLQNLGSVYASMGNAEKAREYYELAAGKAAILNPADAAVNYYNMGVTYINSGKNQEAAEALTKALEYDPTHAESHYQLGITYLGLGQTEECLTHLKRYLELAPGSDNSEVAKALIEQLGGN